MSARQPDAVLQAFALRSGLAQPDDRVIWTALSGGVSSDIWRVDLPSRSICIKRALSKLKVTADWHAPISRNAYEWAWLEFAHHYREGSVPQPLAHDARAGLFAMAFLEPARYPVWKQQLLDGDVNPETALKVGDTLGRLHQASAGKAAIAAAFPTTDIFRAIRLEPYLLATAQAHPDLADTLRALTERTAAARIALVHGDVSPKNILVGVDGPVFLDAECAWYGDPAFDVAFCLKHLLLKCLARPDHMDGYLGSFEGFTSAYLARVTWEARPVIEARAASLLPALLLARIDGKSPVEYITREAERTLVRSIAKPLITSPPAQLMKIADRWRVGLSGAKLTTGLTTLPS
jgi:tRNA A-37 threonylcarbamoyl transferase component Bud32